MFWLDVLFALLAAFLMTAILAWGLRWRHPWRFGLAPALQFLFVILFMAIWAGGLWIQPLVGYGWSLYWLPFFVVGLVMALILAVARPSIDPHDGSENGGRPRRAAQADGGRQGAIYGLLFWVLVAILIMAIIFGYARRDAATRYQPWPDPPVDSPAAPITAASL